MVEKFAPGVKQVFLNGKFVLENFSEKKDLNFRKIWATIGALPEANGENEQPSQHRVG